MTLVVSNHPNDGTIDEEPPTVIVGCDHPPKLNSTKQNQNRKASNIVDWFHQNQMTLNELTVGKILWSKLKIFQKMIVKDQFFMMTMTSKSEKRKFLISLSKNKQFLGSGMEFF